MPRTDSTLKQLAATFRALADPTRLAILRFLVDEGEVFQKRLVHSVGVKQSSISRHLAYLRRQRLVLARRHGRWLYLRAGQLPEAAVELVCTLGMMSDHGRAEPAHPAPLSTPS